MHEVGSRSRRLERVRVDPSTYARSRWTPEYLLALQGRGVQILSVNQLPEDAQDLLLGAREGLTLYFDRGLNALDHAAIQGIIADELGSDTDCEVVELKKQGGTVGQRLFAQNAGHVARAEVVIAAAPRVPRGLALRGPEAPARRRAPDLTVERPRRRPGGRGSRGAPPGARRAWTWCGCG